MNSDKQQLLDDLRSMVSTILDQKIAPSRAELGQVVSRLDSIESMLKQIAFANSPASLSVDEKVRVLSSAMKRGKKALKEAERQINGM